MKKRLDLVLFERGLVPSRERARVIIMSGTVYVNDQKEDKAGTLIADDSRVEIRGSTLPFVSRGGLKLERALDTFCIDLEGKTAIDIGASTGGFTDCMLKRGAKKVYCVDVGYGQLAWTLRNDPRVVNMERTNIRYVKNEDIGEPLDFASVDVSFISLKLVLPVVLNLLSPDGEVVALIKPQFEAGREKVGKKGVVRDEGVHVEVIEKVISFTDELGFSVIGITHSPVKGPQGNIEFLMHLNRRGSGLFRVDPKAIVGEAYTALKGCEKQ